MDSYVPTYKFNDKYAVKHGTTFTTAGNNGIAVHGAPQSAQTLKSAPSKEKTKIQFFRENAILYDPELRKLINESNATFISSRKIESPDDDYRKTLVALSRSHRSTIRQCIENMQYSMKDNSTDKYNDWVEVLDNIDQIWHLCEILFIDCVPGEIILPKLLEWIRLHSASDYDLIASAVLSESHTKGANHRYSNYWELVKGFLMEGRIDATRALLKLHSDSDKSAFTTADEVLRSMPKYNVYCGLSASEYNSRWRGWKSSVQAKMKSGDFLSYPQLQDNIKLVTGGDSTFDALKPFRPTWYQTLVGYLFFNDQTVKIDDLSYYANQCITSYGTRKEDLKLLDQTLLALFDQNIPLAIQKLQLTPDGGWCSVHLTNLLDLAGVIEGEIKDEIDLENMFVTYGQLLITHPSYWQVAFTYFEQCRSQSEIIESELISLSLDSKEKALRMISSAKDYGLEDVANKICALMVRKDRDSGNLAGALSWSIMSNDSESASSIATEYLKRYSLGQTDQIIKCYSVLSNLGQSALISSRLTFLAKYSEFHSLYEEHKIKESAEILIRLLQSKVAPKFFWIILLLDSLVYLTDHSEVFSHDDVTVLLASLEEINSDLESVVPNREDVVEKIKLIRIYIAKCFAESLLKESSIAPNRKNILCQ